MANEIQDSIQDWIKDFPDILIKNISEKAIIGELQAHLDNTLPPQLADAGYKGTVKLLSANFNKIFSLEIKKIAKNNVLEAVGEGVSQEIEGPSSFCLTFEDLSKYVEPDAGVSLTTNRPNEAVNLHMAPVHASKKGFDHRVSLLPLYKGGTLDDKVSYGSYFEAASDKSNDMSNYQTLCTLRAIQNQYFKPHNNIRFTEEGMQSGSTNRVFSYESVNAAIQLYGLAEKQSELFEQSQAPKSNSPLRRLRESFGRQSSSNVEVPIDNKSQKKHIEDFFKFLIYSVEDAIPEGVEKNNIVAHLEDIVKPFKPSPKMPDQAEKKVNLEQVKEAIGLCNVVLSEAINSIQLEASLDEVVKSQQKILLDMSIKVTQLFDTLEQSDVQYYDIKATNFFVVDDKLVFSDTKSLTQRNGDTVQFGLGHMTYKTPKEEFSVAEDKPTVTKEWAKGLTKYQTGILLYDMTIGITGQHIFSKANELLDAGLMKDLDFDHPCFMTETGQVMKTQIQAFTHPDPAQRPDIRQVQQALIALSMKTN